MSLYAGSLAPILQNPLFGATATVAAYAVAASVYARLGRSPLLHPVLTSTAVLGTVLIVTGMPYAVYFRQSFPIHLGLGVVIVLLAVPLFRQMKTIRSAGTAISIALPLGSFAAIATALALPLISGAPEPLLATIAPKSATTAVAVEVADGLGGTPALTAIVVISSGIFGATFGPALLRAVGVVDDQAVGFALGLASHGIGTARAFQISDTAGAFASIGMILNALLTIALVPVVFAVI